MPRIINRAPKTPRKIRDIRPKRQLRRNNEKKQDGDDDGEDDWWSENDGEESQSSLRGRAAVKRLGRRPLERRSARNARADLEEEEEENNRRRSRIFGTFTYIYNAIRQMPPQQRRKRLIWGLVVISAWKTIYLADLDQYSSANIESNTKKGSSSLLPMTYQSIDDVYSPTRAVTDDVPSSMFGDVQPIGNVGSASKKITSGISGSLRNMFRKKDSETRLDSSSQTGNSGSSSLFPQQNSRSMAESYSIGGGASYESGNSMKSPGFSFDMYPSNTIDTDTSQRDSSQSQLSRADSQIPKLNQQQPYPSNQKSYESGNSMKSPGFSFDVYPPNTIDTGMSKRDSSQSQLSWAEYQIPKKNQQQSYTSNQDQSFGLHEPNLFGNAPQNKMESGNSQLGGFWSDSQSPKQNQHQLSGSYQETPQNAHQLGEYSNEKYQPQGLLGQTSLGNAGSMFGSSHNSNSIEAPATYQQPVVSGSDYDINKVGSGFTMNNKDTAIQNEVKMSFSPLSGIGNSQYQNNQNSPVGDRSSQGQQRNNHLGNLQSMAASADGADRGGNAFRAMTDVALQDNVERPFSYQNGIGVSQISSSQYQGNAYQSNPNTKNDYQSNPNTNLNNQQPNLSAPGSATGLDCANYGGPALESDYAEIVYWRDIPTDATFESPYYNPQAQESVSTPFWRTKYLTFEMDDAGWNNMRLGLENVILLAHAMGRTLVMPPKRQLAHGLVDRSGSKVVSFGDFYEIAAISAKQKGLNIISMEQFLEREALNGQLKSRLGGETMYPPNHQIKWDNQRLDPLWRYMRNVTKTFKWNPKECVLAFPAGGTDDQHLFSMMADVLVEKDGRPFPHFSDFQGRPVNVDAPPIERFREILAGRRKICMYDKNMHDDNPVVHFKADQYDGTRLITNFYAFLWFEDWRQDLWSKRFIRDNLRYNNEIMCLSARIISTLRKHARQHSPENINGFYYSIHLRRGDFQQQFPMAKIDASDILASLQENKVAPGSTIFIATNERDTSFFKPIQEVYHVSFLGDFGTMLSNINPNYFPMLEQIVASRGRLFFGTFFSTFSAYIARLRGYYSVKEMQSGYLDGGLKNTFLLPAKWEKEMHLYQAIHKPLFSRDFPVAWRGIDRLELPSAYNKNVQY